MSSLELPSPESKTNSQHLQLEDSLRRSEERYRSLFEAIDEGFCVIEVLFDENNRPNDYRFLEINPAFEKQTGLVGAVGKRMRELAPEHEEHWFKIYGEVALTGEPLRFENRAEALQRWYDVYAYRYGHPGNRHVAVLFNDISVRKNAEASLRQAHAYAEETNRLKDEFLATLSHELRTPLNSILGWANILRTSHLDMETQQRGLEVIERSARSQTQLVNDLLDVSRILIGKLRLDLRPVELSQAIESAVETVLPSAQAKGIHIATILDRSTGLIAGDPDRLSQIFWNLLTNAVKFTPKGGHIEVVMRRADSSVQASVTDNGQGIAPEFLPHVFERFRQADASSTRAVGGLGIGLALVRHLIDAHGGTVQVESTGQGNGATFTLTFPLTAIQPASATSPENSADSSSAEQIDEEVELPSLAGLRILVVDDEPDARNLIEVALTRRGGSVEGASSAATALERVRESWKNDTRFDVLVSDIGMPNEDGYTLMRRIRREEQQTGGFLPAVALTAYANQKDRMNALLAGFQIHIAKPVEPVELVATIASLTARTGRQN